MEKGDFIRWSSTDEEGPFHYVGQVTKVGKDFVEFIDAPDHDIMHVPLDDGVFTKARKPRGWKVVKAKSSKSKKQPSAIKKPQQPQMKKGSKKVLAKEIFDSETKTVDARWARPQIVERYISELNMSKAGAATYFSNFNSGRW